MVRYAIERCRLLGLAPEAQGQIFDLYQAVLEASIQRARKEGKYDEGIVDVKGTSVTLAQEPQVFFFPFCTKLVLVSLHIAMTCITQLCAQALTAPWLDSFECCLLSESFAAFVCDTPKGNLYLQRRFGLSIKHCGQLVNAKLYCDVP